MPDRSFNSIAKDWWKAVQSEDWDATESVQELVDHHPDQIPALLTALVATAPPEGPHYVGTSILEDVYYGARHRELSNSALKYVSRAKLTNAETMALLSGVYPDMLEEWGIREQMSSLLTAQQIDWLTDAGAVGRHDYL
jgi:hypothetical protein